MSGSNHTSPDSASPFTELGRSAWATLAGDSQLQLTETELVQLRGVSEPLGLGEVADVYLPLSRLLSMYAEAAQGLHRATSDFLGERMGTTPFVIGIAGSVAVGKSTVSRLLRTLMSRWESTPRVELVTTDGFLLPNAELERLDLMDRKGFPESYDRRALLEFVTAVKSGAPIVEAPFYSHMSYDIAPGSKIRVEQPEVLIVEGLNVLQPSASSEQLAVSDLFDFSIYVDANTDDIARWYEERFLALQRGAFTNPESYFHRYATLTEDEARQRAREIWTSINLPNLESNILPTRSRAKLILQKGPDHTVERVLLRKV